MAKEITGKISRRYVMIIRPISVHHVNVKIAIPLRKKSYTCSVWRPSWVKVPISVISESLEVLAVDVYGEAFGVFVTYAIYFLSKDKLVLRVQPQGRRVNLVVSAVEQLHFFRGKIQNVNPVFSLIRHCVLGV